MSDDRAKRLAEFVAYAKRLRGDEKGEAQVFLDRLFRAFGREGYKEAGATLEERVKKSEGGTAFADLVWKPIVLVEMKKRGEDLSKHLQQAFDYWVELVPNRPRYVVLCNFDEFRVYDFDLDINEPQDTVTLNELPERYGPLNFLFPTSEKPVFRVDREKVTREAADLLAAVHTRLAHRKDVGAETAQRFILQMLVALFSEDIGLLPKHFVTQLLDECVDPPKAFDLLNGLFTAMATKSSAKGGRFKDVPYFNGGIFAKPAPVELAPEDEVSRLKKAAEYNWAHISPDIFGTIFQHSMDAEERHAFGAHYTSPVDIMKIVGPTIVRPWRTAIESARSVEKLRALQQRLYRLRVLDPACGSGNFLYIAYRELKRVEKELLDRIRTVAPKRDRGQREFGFVTSKQFFGMDILPFAVELAKVTMTLAHKLAIDELHVEEKALPLDNLDKNIVCMDSLINADGSRAEWPEADIVIGNPPFLGSRYFAKEHGYEYVRRVHAAFPDVPKMADYCVYWIRRAHDHVRPVTPADPFAGRVGLVGTQNIRNNQSRVGGLDHVAKSGVIIEAVENQPWSGEANVNVSIANWVKTPEASRTRPALEESLLIPERRRLWSKVDPRSRVFEEGDNQPRPKVLTRGMRGTVRKDKSYELQMRECASINSSLSDEISVAGAAVLRCNADSGLVFQGQTPCHDGFLITPVEARSLITIDGRLREVLFPYMIGRDIMEDGVPTRWAIDFGRMDLLTAASYDIVFRRVKRDVMDTVLEKARSEKEATGKTSTRWTRMAERWWQFRDYQPGTMTAIARIPRYIVCSRVTKRPVFVFLSSEIHPDSALIVFPLADDYSFAMLQSDTHWRWFVAKCSKLAERYRYTPDSVFDTFPWPQSPSQKQVQIIAAAGREIRRIRDEALPKIKGGLRALYRTLELPGKNPLKDAHAALDAAVLAAYGFSPKKDLLKQLLDLNLAVAAAIDRGEAVTAPGVPASYGDAADLITEDCIRP